LGKVSVIQRFKADQLLVAKIEQLEIYHPDLFEQIIRTTESYFREIGKAGITDEQLDKTIRASFPKLLVKFFGVLLSVPVFAFGFLFNAIPFFIPRLLLTRKVKDPTFLSTFNFVSGLVLFPLCYLIEWSLVFIFTDSFIAALVVLGLAPFAGKYAFQLAFFYGDLFQSVKMKLINRSLLKRLSKLRTEATELIIRNTAV
jgi:ABC-type multidrug transport system fused ATPase/permease subunit